MSRDSFSLTSGIKRAMSPLTRVSLCNNLQDHFHEAMSHYPDQPLEVTIGEDTYGLSAHMQKPGKVHVRGIHLARD